MASVLVAQLCFHYWWYYSPKFHHDFSTTIITSNNNSSNGSKSVGGLGILVSQPLEVEVLAFPLVDETPWNWKLNFFLKFWILNWKFWNWNNFNFNFLVEFFFLIQQFPRKIIKKLPRDQYKKTTQIAIIPIETT